MAKERSEVKRVIEGHLTPILSHWGLILWRRQYCNTYQSIDHWKSELNTFLNNIFDVDFRYGNWDRLIKDCLLRSNELNDSDAVLKRINRKFKKEGITDPKIIKDISFQISSHIEDLIIALGEEGDHIQWIASL